MEGQDKVSNAHHFSTHTSAFGQPHEVGGISPHCTGKRVSTDILEVTGSQVLEEGGRGMDQTGTG